MIYSNCSSDDNNRRTHETCQWAKGGSPLYPTYLSTQLHLRHLQNGDGVFSRINETFFSAEQTIKGNKQLTNRDGELRGGRGGGRGGQRKVVDEMVNEWVVGVIVSDDCLDVSPILDEQETTHHAGQRDKGLSERLSTLVFLLNGTSFLYVIILSSPTTILLLFPLGETIKIWIEWQ